MEKLAKEIRHIREEIPIVKYDEEKECFLCEDASCIKMYQIKPKDLVNSDMDEIEMDCFKWAKFYKTYGLDIQIFTLHFPCDTGEPQRYWKKRLEGNQNPDFTEMIERKINELEWREKHTASKEFFLVCYFADVEEMENAVGIIASTLEIGEMGLVKEVSKEKQELVWFKFANKNSLIF